MSIIPIVINACSFSFQISGAIILLLWSLRKCDTRIKKMCLESNLQWLDFDGNTIISKKKLQSNAKNVFLNVCAFVNIAIGYGCAIFSQPTEICEWLLFLIVIATTTLIIVIEFIIVTIIAKLKYPTEQKVNVDKLFEE